MLSGMDLLAESLPVRGKTAEEALVHLKVVGELPAASRERWSDQPVDL